MTINKLKPGEKAAVKKINLPWRLCRRLMELGILPEAKIIMLTRNLFGGIYLLSVGGTHIALEEKIAQAIEIQK
ncbi:hypothetical protein AMJ51_01350 [Microgenomates bacterium DG_75]|nr:MAG: hypothetical protein AMJ51_01350 [Microgenomates bacterium DG_75]